MILYSTTITPRLRYICDFVGTKLTGKPIELTESKELLLNSQDIKVNYSREKIGDELWVQPHSLLFESAIIKQAIECFDLNNQKAFFKTGGDFHFDIFAASFYLLSRYEEYLPHQEDSYGRYAHENSLAFKEDFLAIPLINHWLKDLKETMKRKFPSFPTHQSAFTFFPTYDIDEAYSYKHKDWWRNAGAAFKDLVKGNLDKLALRRKVLYNQQQDPFDAYDWMNNLHLAYKLKPHYFFLLAEKTGKYDRNILPRETAIQELIRQHAEKYDMGIHPSWQSGDDASLIKKEIQTLENISAIKISSSRQHFIRFTLPQTYRHLLNAGIKEDFSMGYGSINGFRASVASSFYWYDLEKEQTTSLLLHPFCYMEANSFFEQKFTPQQALDEMRHYYNTVKAVSGTMITIWHNTFLGTDKLFEGWREVYKQFIDEVDAQAQNSGPS